MSGSVTGECPYDGCEHKFLYADEQQVGEHFNSHLRFTLPVELAAIAAIQVMVVRRKQDV